MHLFGGGVNESECLRKNFRRFFMGRIYSVLVRES